MEIGLFKYVSDKKEVKNFLSKTAWGESALKNRNLHS